MIGAAQAGPRAGGSRWRHLRRRELWPALLFISPWVIGFAWFQLYPIVASVYYSFTEYNIMQPPVFVGLANFQQLFGNDDLFKQALAHTAIFTLFSVPLDLAVALFFAILLNRNIPGRPFFRTAFYFPSVVPSVATGILWIMLLNPQGGLVNAVLGAFGIPSIPWLVSPEWAMPSLILLSVWGIGPTVVIFLAGLQDVPRVLYEAAQMDGANARGTQALDARWAAARRRANLVDRAGKTAAFAVVLFFALLFVFPIYWMIATSLKATPEVYRLPPVWWPAIPMWHNYP